MEDDASISAKAKKNADYWDPDGVLNEVHSPQALARVKRDIKDICDQPPPGVFISPEENQITTIHALVIGPLDTPYEGGFFHFFVKCPTDYPIAPPRVRLLTTDGGRVRFNPNLYACGKVCLSILGTWYGPAWSAAQGIGSVLVSIQSLMSDNPYHNEPGFEKERHPGDAARYNAIIQHETIRVAVCDTVELCLSGQGVLPPALREVVLQAFPEYYDSYQNNTRAKRLLCGTDMTPAI
ncbi:ubiquitin-conjugating enzyme E2 Z-like [Haemaphysalis longicornis]